MVDVPAPVRTTGVPQVLAAATDGRVFAGLLSGGVEVVRARGTRGSSTVLAVEGGVRALALRGGADGVVAATSAGLVTALDVSGGGLAPAHAFQAAAGRAPTALAGFRDGLVGFVGDEAGGVLRADLRVARPTAHAFEQGDYISALHVLGGGGGALLAASGDGTLAVYDARKPGAVALAAVAPAFDDDLCALAVAPAAAVAGTLEGALHAYDVPQLARLARGGARDGEEVAVRRFRGHPEAVNALALVAGIVVTACADGLLRAVDPASGKLLALLDFDRSWAHADGPAPGDGDEPAAAGASRKRRRAVKWPVEAMAVIEGPAGQPELLALAGHEECIRFADLSVLADSDGEGEEKEEERDPTPPPEPPRRKSRGKKKGSTFGRKKRDLSFFGDL